MKVNQNFKLSLWSFSRRRIHFNGHSIGRSIKEYNTSSKFSPGRTMRGNLIQVRKKGLNPPHIRLCLCLSLYIWIRVYGVHVYVMSRMRVWVRGSERGCVFVCLWVVTKSMWPHVGGPCGCHSLHIAKRKATCGVVASIGSLKPGSRRNKEKRLIQSTICFPL